MTKAEKAEGPAEEVKGEACPVCHEKTLTLLEMEREVPYFGKVAIFSMTCEGCKFHKADVECLEKNEPARYTVELSSEEDMKIRVIRSSEGTIKIPHLASIEPGPAANGYVTNVEGILNRIKHQLEAARDAEEDLDEKQKYKNPLKKLIRIQWGQEKAKLIVEDPTGNSAIISEKAVKETLKGKKE